MSLQLDDLKYFLKVAESLNVTRASEQLGITQPTLSYSIKRLETELGGELIIRLKNGIQLTKLGEDFRIKCRELILNWENLKKLVNPEDVEVKGEYTLAIHPSVALYTLDKFLPQVVEKYPLLNFKLLHGLSREMTEKVISWEADFGIVVNPIPHPDLVIKELYKDTVTLFALKGASQKLIMDPELHQTQFVVNLLKRKNFSITDTIKSGNLEVVYKLASAGLGLGLLPQTIAKANPKLMRVKDAPAYEDRICLIYRREKHRTNVSKFIFETILSSLN